MTFLHRISIGNQKQVYCQAGFHIQTYLAINLVNKDNNKDKILPKLVSFLGFICCH